MRQQVKFLFILSVLPFMMMGVSNAQIAMDGEFKATQKCPAYQSFRQQTNPGNVSIKPNQSYELLGKNAENPSHYYIRVKNAKPDKRWVNISCGELVNNNSDALSGLTNIAYEYILAVSWQPAFCETRPDRPECISQTSARFDATHFSLHGLWPKGRHCGVPQNIIAIDKPKTWCQLPKLDLEPETRQALDKIMPGSQSCLDRHEWIAHGTCYHNKSSQIYYRDSIRLMNELNAKNIDELFVAAFGRELNIKQIRAAFDKEFGVGAGQKIDMQCKHDRSNQNRYLITELQISLKGDVSSQSLSELIMAAPRVRSDCTKGLVDPAGFQ